LIASNGFKHAGVLWLTIDKGLAEWTGLEPATPGVTGRYSNQLNYHSITYIKQELLKPNFATELYNYGQCFGGC
jgi:hypothetical protein